MQRILVYYIALYINYILLMDFKINEYLIVYFLDVVSSRLSHGDYNYIVCCF